jgi:hypothetical protein
MFAERSLQRASKKETVAMGAKASHSQFDLRRNSVPQRRCEPFRDSEEAWFWTMAALMARREGARYTANQGRVMRPCEPDDVVKCLDGLYRRRRIDLLHARILRLWGERQISPNPAFASERCDWRLWHEALERLEWPLRVKGIVG